MKRPIILLLIFIAAACSSRGEDKLKIAARVYIDNMAIDEKYAGKSDSIKFYRDKVFSKYKMSEEDYKKFLNEFSTDKGKWDSFFAESEKYLDSLKSSYKAK